MTFEQWVAQQGYRPQGGGMYAPANPYSESGQAPNLNEATLRDMYYQATGQANPMPSFGSMGQVGAESVNVGGQLMRRVGESNIYGNPSIYDPTYGYLFPEEQYKALTAKAIEDSSKWGPLEYATLALFGGGLGALGAGAGAAGAAGGTTASAAGGGVAGGSIYGGTSVGGLLGAESAAGSLAAGGTGVGGYIGSAALPASYGAGAGAAGAGLGYTATLPDGSVASLGNADGIGGSFSNVSTDGGVSGSGYNFDPYTGDTVGLGNSPTTGGGFTTNPSLESLGGTSGGSSGFGANEFFNFGKQVLNTPGVSSAISSALQSRGVSQAVNAQTQAAQAAAAERARQQQEALARSGPWIQTGASALSKLAEHLGLAPGTNGTVSGDLSKPFTGANLQNEPGYQFGLSQGQKTLENSRAAAGGLYSGATGKALQQFGQDYAGTKYGEAFNRDLQNKQLTYNQLAGVSGTGQTAVNQVNSLGATTGAGIAGDITGAGNASASGNLAQANIGGNLINQFASQLKNYLGSTSQDTNATPSNASMSAQALGGTTLPSNNGGVSQKNLFNLYKNTDVYS